VPEDSPTDMATDVNDGNPVVGRHRAPGRRHPVRLYAAAAAATGVLFALSSGEVSAVSSERPDQIDSASLRTAQQEREQSAERADRSSRDALNSGSAALLFGPVAPSPTATPSPTASPSPTTSPSPTAKPKTTAKPKATPSPRPSWVNPMPAGSTTSCYGSRWGSLHAGVDLAAPANTPVRAAGAGTVVDAGWISSGYGISVVVDHGNGYLTHYAHLNSNSVGVGTRVAAGEVIGREGSTGDSSGPHLHFEVHQGGMWNQIDPAPFMRERGVSLGC